MRGWKDRNWRVYLCVCGCVHLCDGFVFSQRQWETEKIAIGRCVCVCVRLSVEGGLLSLANQLKCLYKRSNITGRDIQYIMWEYEATKMATHHISGRNNIRCWWIASTVWKSVAEKQHSQVNASLYYLSVVNIAVQIYCVPGKSLKWAITFSRWCTHTNT